LKARAANGSAGSAWARDLLAVARIGADHRRNVERRRQVLDHGVEHRLDALVLEGGAAQDGDDLRGQGAGAQGAAQRLGVNLLPLEEAMRDVVIEVGHGLDQLVAPGGGVLGQVGRDLPDLDQVAQVVAISDRLHLEQVDHAAEAALRADRQLHRHCGCAEAVADHVHDTPEVGAGAVQLVDEAEARHDVTIGLAPDRLRLRLDAGHAVEDDDSAVQHAQAALDLNGEVHVPGRIDDVNSMLVPEARRSSRGDRDPALLLLRHPVHRRSTLMHLADLVDLLGVKEDALGDRGLAGVDMGNDADVARTREAYLARHISN